MSENDERVKADLGKACRTGRRGRKNRATCRVGAPPVVLSRDFGSASDLSTRDTTLRGIVVKIASSVDGGVAREPAKADHGRLAPVTNEEAASDTGLTAGRRLGRVSSDRHFRQAQRLGADIAMAGEPDSTALAGR